jgi:hypothetical protein
MKATFKPLSLAVAVAAASAGYVGIVNAQTLAGNTGLGDLAIVPYYTVQAGWSTGVNVINSSSETQVVKIRLRRQVDSMDALDFNVVLSPNDVWSGYVQAAGEDIRFYTNDNSCTVPALTSNYLQMPNIYREGAEEGYIEIIGMGAADDLQPISRAALHDSDGIPANCGLARENFFGGTTSSDYAAAYPTGSGRTKGVINSALTRQETVNVPLGSPGLSNYIDTDNVLKVSWFIKSDVQGNEFGGDAVHIADFMSGPSITNQQRGINEGDLQGFDHPDLNGGAPTSVIIGVGGVGQRGSYNPLRVALGASAVINDWSANTTADFTVDTDWVVTTPGQYLMTNLSRYIDSLEEDGDPCGPSADLNAFSDDYIDDEDSDDFGDNCDFRDIPLTVSATVFDREERGIEVEEDDLVVSPQPPGEPTIVQFDQEVNVIQWGTNEVVNSDKNVIVPVPTDAQFGWATVSVEPNDDTIQAICDFGTFGDPVAVADSVFCNPTSTPVPLVGFVAWQRNFAAMPEANYGRAVDHSYVTSSAP